MADDNVEAEPVGSVPAFKLESISELPALVAMSVVDGAYAPYSLGQDLTGEGVEAAIEVSYLSSANGQWQSRKSDLRGMLSGLASTLAQLRDDIANLKSTVCELSSCSGSSFNVFKRELSCHFLPLSSEQSAAVGTCTKFDDGLSAAKTACLTAAHALWS